MNRDLITHDLESREILFSIPQHVMPSDEKVLKQFTPGFFDHIDLDSFVDEWNDGLEDAFKSYVYENYPESDSGLYHTTEELIRMKEKRTAEIMKHAVRDPPPNHNCGDAGCPHKQPISMMALWAVAAINDRVLDFNGWKPFDYPIFRMGCTENDVTSDSDTLIVTENDTKKWRRDIHTCVELTNSCVHPDTANMTRVAYRITCKRGESFTIPRTSIMFLEGFMFEENKVPDVFTVEFNSNPFTIHPTQRYNFIGMIPFWASAYTNFEITIGSRPEVGTDESNISFDLIFHMFKGVDVFRDGDQAIQVMHTKFPDADRRYFCRYHGGMCMINRNEEEEREAEFQRMLADAGVEK